MEYCMKHYLKIPLEVVRVFIDRMNIYQKWVYYSGLHNTAWAVQLWLPAH